MTHYAVLRHHFDIHRNPDRLGPLYDDEKFCLALNGHGEPPTWLVGNVVWLVSWEGFMKTHHVICGWFRVSQIGKRHGVVAQHYAGGNDGELYPRGLGPLDMHGWFHKFVEANRRFREGEPTEIDEHLNDLVTLARVPGYRVPPVEAPAWEQVTHGPASL
jgi:hypothetical protein